MKKIGDITNTADKNGEFTDGNVAAGTPPTQLMGAWFNSVQREILNVLAKAGVPQSATKEDQLAEAITKLVAGADYLPTGYSYSKKESDDKYQPKGNYAPSGDYVTSVTLNNGLELKFDKKGGVVSGDISATGDISSTAGKVILKLETKGEKTAIVSNLGSGYRAHTLQDKSGTLAHHGDFGLGTDITKLGMNYVGDANSFDITGFTSSAAGSVNFFAVPAPMLSIARSGGVNGTGFITQIQGDAKDRIAFRQRERGTWRGWYEFLTEANTSKDASGFVRTGTATALTTGDITQTTGGYSNKVMSQEATTNAINAIKMLGNGQKWTDVKSGRQPGVNYTNSTGRTIAIFVSTTNANAASSITIYVDGVICSSYGIGGNSSDLSRQSMGNAIIPAGSTYRVDATSIGIWAELR
nr:hypothetical protein [Providencia stuartii]ELR5082439.1 hypothetical protein [Providencia stuartii]